MGKVGELLAKRSLEQQGFEARSGLFWHCCSRFVPILPLYAFVVKFGGAREVCWVNETGELGLPFDLILSGLEAIFAAIPVAPRAADCFEPQVRGAACLHSAAMEDRSRANWRLNFWMRPCVEKDDGSGPVRVGPVRFVPQYAAQQRRSERVLRGGEVDHIGPGALPLAELGHALECCEGDREVFEISRAEVTALSTLGHGLRKSHLACPCILKMTDIFEKALEPQPDGGLCMLDSLARSGQDRGTGSLASSACRTRIRSLGKLLTRLHRIRRHHGGIILADPTGRLLQQNSVAPPQLSAVVREEPTSTRQADPGLPVCFSMSVCIMLPKHMHKHSRNLTVA